MDTVLELFDLDSVDFLKVDAQGADLAVVRSAGDGRSSIARIKLEVAVAEFCVYEGATTKPEVLEFMEGRGFSLVDAQRQTYDQEENLLFARC